MLTVRSLIIICPPNRVAVISGRSRQLSDGRTVGYRAIRGGRTLRVRPPWEAPQPGTIDVAIEPAQAFGTGAHETTIREYQVGPERLRVGPALQLEDPSHGMR